MARRSKIEKEVIARCAGICVQGLILGLLLSFAILELWAQADSVRLFRYQNF